MRGIQMTNICIWIGRLNESGVTDTTSNYNGIVLTGARSMCEKRMKNIMTVQWMAEHRQ